MVQIQHLYLDLYTFRELYVQSMFAIIARTSECRSENVDNYDYNHEDSNGRVIPENYKDESQKE